MSSELTRYDRAIEYIFNRNATAEAKEWVSDQSKGPRVICEFDKDESEYIIDTAYAKGADEVLAVGDQDAIDNYGSIDMLLLRCPDDPIVRSGLFEFEDMVARESGFEGSLDQGQRYILLRWT